MILGAVLAGGRATRFGSDKALAPFDGARLVDHAAALLLAHVGAVVVVGRANGVPDLPAPHLGPLGGVAGALDWAAEHGFASVVTIGCDMPRLPEGLIEALLRRAPSYCPDAPVLGHWPAVLGAHALAQIEGGSDRSMRGWARAVGAIPVPSPTPIANINRPEDLLIA